MGDEQILQEFLQRMVSEGLISEDVALTDQDIAAILQSLKSGNEAAALSYAQSRGQSVDWAADDAASIAGAKGGNTQPNTPSLVNTWQDPNTGQWFYMVPQVNTDGELINYRPTPFTPPKADNPADLFVGFDYEMTPGWMTPVFEKPDGSQYVKQPTQKATSPDTGEPSPFEREQFEYGKSQDAASAALAQQQLEYKRQQDANAELNDIWARREGYAQAETERLSKQPDFWQQPAPENTAFNWLNYWKSQSGPKRTSEKGAQDILRANVSPETIRSTWQANNPGNTWGVEGKTTWDPLTGSYRPVTQQEFESAATEDVIRKASRGEGVPGGNEYSQWLNPGSPWYVPANEDQASFREQLQGMGLLGGNGPVGTGWTPYQQELVEDLAKRYERAPGPEVPEYLRGVLQGGGQVRDRSRTVSPGNTFATRQATPGSDERAYVNLKTLGREGNVVRPVSAQTYQNWMPSQREGYAGLVGAQKGANVGDYMDNLGKMWTSSRRGQLAVRR